MNPLDVIFTLPKDEIEIGIRLSRRTKPANPQHLRYVLDFFDDVALRGDAALRDATAKFDHVELCDLRLPKEYVDRCASSVPADLSHAIQMAMANIAQVNHLLMPEKHWQQEIRPGTIVGEKAVPLDSVALWIPCRKGPLISTALMLVMAARVAGVKRIAVAMPPAADGRGDSNTVAAARMAGAQEFYIGNGIAMVAAFAQGTETISEVDGIFGPGPGVVAAAMAIAGSMGKRTVVGIGPTDCAIIADSSAHAELVALDLLSEAEHGPDSTAILITPSKDLAREVANAVFREIASSPIERRGFLQENIGPQGTSSIIVAQSLDTACTLANAFAAEHLMIHCNPENQQEILRQIRHAGEILLGSQTPFSAANYAIGITAVLPTNGFSRCTSGITCRDMIKYCTIGQLDAPALEGLLPVIETIGRHEGLPGHRAAARARFAV